MNFKRIGLIALGVIFLLFGILSFAAGFNYSASHTRFITTFDDTVANTLRSIDETRAIVLNDPEYLEELRMAGNIEKYKVEYAQFRKEFVTKTGLYKTKYIEDKRHLPLLSFLLSFFLLISSFGLLTLKKWGRVSSLITIGLLFAFYICILYNLYPVLEITQLICNGGHKFNIMVNPSYTDTDFAKCASSDPYISIKQMLYGHPSITIAHSLVLLSSLFVSIYLTRPSVKQLFK